jgi:hypothetical protein
MLANPHATPASATDRPCRICRRIRPAAEFRLRSRSGTIRLSECNQCHATAERARRAAARDRATGRTIAHAAAKIKRAGSFHQVARVIADMAAHFGDTARFVATWQAQVDAAMDRRPGSKMVLDTFMALATMLMHVEMNRPQQPEMSLAEAHAILDRLMKQAAANTTAPA